MVQAFSSYVKKNINITPGNRVLLGVSGGVDSMVLACLFLSTDIAFEIAHCNFKLRGEQSDKDETFVLDFAKKHSIRFHNQIFNTVEIANQTGVSLQMAARELRYDWFFQLMEKNKFDFLAIAHHRDDEYETILFNLIKGTGISGLTGWEAKKNQIIRPLLFTNRSEILDFAMKNGVQWREDLSNTNTKYTRNKIRHKIVPVINEINPGYLDTYKGTKVRLIENERLLANVLDHFYNNSVIKRGSDLFIASDKLRKVEYPTQAIYYVIKQFGFNYKQCIDIWNAIEQPGKIFNSHSHTLNVDRKEIIISDSNPHIEMKLINEKDSKAVIGKTEFSFESLYNLSTLEIKATDKNTAYLDKEKLAFPLQIKPVSEGDLFVPLGMTGKKKISDFMIDEKIPVNLKSRVLTIVSDNKIAWIAGHRIDDRFKITAGTKNIFCIKMVINAT